MAHAMLFFTTDKKIDEGLRLPDTYAAKIAKICVL